MSTRLMEEIDGLRDLLLDSIGHSPLCTSSHCYCEFDKRKKAVDRLCNLASDKGSLLKDIRSWLWLHHPTSRQWEQSSAFFAKAITSFLGDK